MITSKKCIKKNGKVLTPCRNNALKAENYFIKTLRLNRNNLFALVRTASSASSVRHFELTAGRTLYHSRYRKLPISSPFISSGFWCFSLWNCHNVIHLFLIITKYNGKPVTRRTLHILLTFRADCQECRTVGRLCRSCIHSRSC